MLFVVQLFTNLHAHDVGRSVVKSLHKARHHDVQLISSLLAQALDDLNIAHLAQQAGDHFT